MGRETSLSSFMFSAYFASRFPEDMYLVDKRLEDDYTGRVIYGFNRMAELTLTIGILARNIEQIAPYTIARIHALRSFFRASSFVAYENDSSDRTKDILFPAVDYLQSESLNWPVNIQDKSEARKIRMAYYRNACRDIMLKYPADYYAVYDSDILGGFSYEGVANSFSYEWDVCGSNSVIYDNHDSAEQLRRLYYDTWAYRDLGVIDDGTQKDAETKNLMFRNRGEPPVRVTSCFGGLAFYKAHAFSNPKYRYTEKDCDHPTLHIPMWQDGLRLFMNPSQIVLYNKTRYVA